MINMLRNSLNKWTKRNWPLPQNSMFFFRGGGGIFVFHVFLFSDIWSNQCLQKQKSIFWIARNICRVIIDFSRDKKQKRFRYRTIDQKRHFSLSEGNAIDTPPLSPKLTKKTGGGVRILPKNRRKETLALIIKKCHITHS